MKHGRMTKKVVSDFEAIYRARESRARKKRRQHPSEWVEASRVRPLILEWIRRFERANDAQAVGASSIGAREALAFRASTDPRTIYRIIVNRPRVAQVRRGRLQIEGGERFLSIDLVDRLFDGMDCLDLFHVHPTNPEKTDGFADVYFHPSIMNDPEQSEEADDRFDRALALAGIEGLDALRETVIA